MSRRRMFWRLYPAFVMILTISLLAMTWTITRSLRGLYIEHVQADLAARAMLFGQAALPRLETADAETLAAWCRETGRASNTRVTLILPSGQVVGDSDENPAHMENHAGRPEVAEALDGRIGRSIRSSVTRRQTMVYVAVPVKGEKGLRVVARAAKPIFLVEEWLRDFYLRVGLGGVVTAGLAALASWMLYVWITGPLESIRQGARRMAQGNLAARIPAPDSEEMAGLVHDLNQMAAQLDERIRAAYRQKSERETILASMVEGVLAVDSGERILVVNQAAGRILGVSPEAVRGRTIQEVARSPELQRFVGQALAASGPLEGSVVLRDGNRERVLQLHGSVLKEGEGPSGAVVVLQDITHLRHLENVRRDFVANVSHELKTPITAIKGYLETLLDEEPSGPEETRRFLEVAARHADRLSAIIDDLLLLSRMDWDSATGSLETQERTLKDLLAEAVEAALPQAGEKDIEVGLSCADDLTAKVNAPLLTQAVVNLVDNAIKYSEPGRPVRVEAGRDPEGVHIAVVDQGSGISAEHLPRIFERFYRVDKARSRRMGGTGLGLAITRHIVEAHGGTLSVQSAPGRGSTFTIRLPEVVTALQCG